MAKGVELQKMDEKIALFTIHSAINANSEEGCDYINNTMDELEKDGYVKYIFDLQHLNLANSRFIGLIAKRHHGLTEKSGRITILKAQDMVNKSFEISGLSDMIQFYTDQDDAIKGFKD